VRQKRLYDLTSWQSRNFANHAAFFDVELTQIMKRLKESKKKETS